MRLAIASLLVLLTGCSASLRGDAFYACADGHCPAGYVCHSDALCYRGPELPDTGPTVDAFVPVDMGMTTTCSGMMMGTCPAPQQCVQGQWGPPSGGPTYQCAGASQIAALHHGDACTMGDATCNAPDVCIGNPSGGRCLRPCMPMGTGCGFMEECVMPIGATMGGVCARPCGTPATCLMFGFMCSAGHCLPPGW